MAITPRPFAPLVLAIALTAQAQPPAVDPEIAAAIARIPAIDNHAHPGEAPDQEFDALPVDNLEASSDPVRLRPGNPEAALAQRALYNPGERPHDAHSDDYPARMLDRMGIGVMLANRVALGAGLASPRFLWVSFGDALLFPLDNSNLRKQTPDRNLFFPLEERLLARYLKESGYAQPPATLDEYLGKVVTAVLERHKRGGAVALKFEAAYLRSLNFGNPSKADAAAVYARRAAGPPSNAEYKTLQDYLFRYLATECGRLGMAVHIHAFGGAGSYFGVRGMNPLLLEDLFNDPALRKTNFVLIHGGWPFTSQVTALLTKPNVYADFSSQTLVLYPRQVAATIREWLEYVPEKVLFASDAYPFSEELGWEESGWISARAGREALGIALTGMLRDGEITRPRALELAALVLRGNAARLYGLK
jgi:hypothetical protein